MGVIAGLAVAGTALGAYGSAKSASAANAAARNANLQNVTFNNRQRDVYGGAMFGAGPSNQALQGWLSDNPGWMDRLNSFSGSLGGPLTQQMRDLSGRAQAQTAALPAHYGAMTQGIMGQAGANVRNIRGQSDAGLALFDRQAQQLNSNMSNWGTGRERIIERDAGKQQRAMDDTSRAALAQSGLGNSTLLANQLGANARNVGEQKQNQLQNLGESQIDRSSALGRSLMGQRATMGESARGADERGLAQYLQTMQGRADNQFNIESQGIDRQMQQGLMPINFTAQALGSSQWNPYNSNPAQFPQAQYSPGAAVAGAAGQGLAGLGGYLALQGMYGQKPGGGNPYAMGYNPGDNSAGFAGVGMGP